MDLTENVMDYGLVDVYAGNLPANCTEVDLRNILEQFGPVSHVKIIEPLTRPHQPSSEVLSYQKTKYGFAKFRFPMDAQAAVTTNKDVCLNGYSLRINWASKTMDWGNFLPSRVETSSPVGNCNTSQRFIPAGLPIDSGSQISSSSGLGRGRRMRQRKLLSQQENQQKQLNDKLHSLEKEELASKVKILQLRVQYLDQQLTDIKSQRDMMDTLNIDTNLAQITVYRETLHKKRNDPVVYKSSSTVEALETKLQEAMQLIRDRSSDESHESLQKSYKYYQELRSLGNNGGELSEIHSATLESAAKVLKKSVQGFLHDMDLEEYIKLQSDLQVFTDHLVQKCPSLKDAQTVTMKEVKNREVDRFDVNAMLVSIDTKQADQKYEELCQAMAQVVGFLTSPWDEKPELPDVADLSYQVQQTLKEEVDKRKELRMTRLEAGHVKQLFGKLKGCLEFISEELSKFKFVYDIAERLDNDHNFGIRAEFCLDEIVSSSANGKTPSEDDRGIHASVDEITGLNIELEKVEDDGDVQANGSLAASERTLKTEIDDWSSDDHGLGLQ